MQRINKLDVKSILINANEFTITYAHKSDKILQSFSTEAKMHNFLRENVFSEADTIPIP